MTNNTLSTFHTPADLAEFDRLGIDPATTQPREKPVPCNTCRRPTTNQNAGCDTHYEHRHPYPV